MTLENPHFAAFPPWLFAVSLGSLIASYTVQPTPHRWMFWVIIVAANAYLTFTTTGQPGFDYFLGAVLVGMVYIGADFILLTEVQRELRVVGQKEEIENAPFSSRLSWGLWLFQSLRGVGWNWEPRGVFRPRVLPRTTPSAFLVRKLLVVTANFFLLDAASIYNRSSPGFARDGIPLASRPLIWRITDLFFFAVTSFAQLQVFHGTISLALVGTGYSDPQDWVHPFGYWGDAYTIRRFWGRVWHQFIRKCLSAPGKYIAFKVLHLERGGNAASYLQLYTAFFFSTILHIIADLKLHRHWGASGSLFLFGIQPFIITLEDGVLNVARRLGVRPSSAWKLLGYIWVTAWFLTVWPVWFQPMVSAKFMDIGLSLPFSVILGVTTGKWQQLDA